MKRKIAAIFAADIAGYSRLVAEDEEETLRRLASYRQVTDDFIAKAGGRIFNTAGDAVLAEFPSAVEAVRCAIDIQESLRTRNMAYPPSRQMAFRIGITIGDVVERDGDLLGDGVNIAARLEGLAEIGGICISRAVHEQVANKLSVQFADIGAQEVKNIPTPVHAYMVAMRREDGSYTTPQARKPARPQVASPPNWMWPAAATIIGLAAIGVGGFVYFSRPDTSAASKVAAANHPPAVSPATANLPAPTAVAAAGPPTSSYPAASSNRFAAADIPFIGDKARAALATDYAPATGFKAFSLNVGGFSAFVTGQPSEEAARTAAVEQCQKRADTAQSPRKCEVYAVGDAIVYAHGKPPLPPMPWIRPSEMTAQPFAAASVPLLRDASRARLETVYAPARKHKAVALGPGGTLFFTIALDSAEEAMRRSLESCGGIAGVPCTIVALNDAFVIPIPAQLKVTGFFRLSGSTMIAADARDDVARRLADAEGGWSAIAVGSAGRPGLGLKGATEERAVNDALADCGRRDGNCRVIAIGPFAVGPN
jgi:class 3 adenylate cyclase